MNKANTSDKETPFLDSNIKVIGSNIHTSVCDKRDDFGFPIVNFSWLSADVPRLPSYGIYISQLVQFARCCISVFDFHSKNLQTTSKLQNFWHRVTNITSFGKRFGSSNSVGYRFRIIYWTKKERFIKFSLKLRIFHLSIVKKCIDIYICIIINVSRFIWHTVVLGKISQ